MKPTKEIIELSKKLHELGYRQDVYKSDSVVYLDNDWFISKEIEIMTGYDFEISQVKGSRTESVQLDWVIPIPSLEDGLEWLKEQVDETITVSFNKYGSSLIFGNMYDFTQANTPRETVLKAMAEVLEKKKESHEQ